MDEPNRDECLGCRTAGGAFGADEVYRDDRVVAVVSLHGVNPGHLVVVTREHVRSALVMEDGLLCHMVRVGRELARRLRETLPCSGVMLIFNNEAPCQTLFHAHLHVVPREPGDAMDAKWGGVIPPAERARLAALLRPALGRSLPETEEGN